MFDIINNFIRSRGGSLHAGDTDSINALVELLEPKPEPVKRTRKPKVETAEAESSAEPEEATEPEPAPTEPAEEP